MGNAQTKNEPLKRKGAQGDSATSPFRKRARASGPRLAHAHPGLTGIFASLLSGTCPPNAAVMMLSTKTRSALKRCRHGRFRRSEKGESQGREMSAISCCRARDNLDPLQARLSQSGAEDRSKRNPCSRRGRVRNPSTCLCRAGPARCASS